MWLTSIIKMLIISIINIIISIFMILVIVFYYFYLFFYSFTYVIAIYHYCYLILLSLLISNNSSNFLLIDAFLSQVSSLFYKLQCDQMDAKMTGTQPNAGINAAHKSIKGKRDNIWKYWYGQRERKRDWERDGER